MPAEFNLHAFLSRLHLEAEVKHICSRAATFVVNLPIQRLSVPFLAALTRLFDTHLLTVCIQLFLSSSTGFIGPSVHFHASDRPPANIHIGILGLFVFQRFQNVLVRKTSFKKMESAKENADVSRKFYASLQAD